MIVFPHIVHPFWLLCCEIYGGEHYVIPLLHSDMYHTTFIPICTQLESTWSLAAESGHSHEQGAHIEVRHALCHERAVQLT